MGLFLFGFVLGIAVGMGYCAWLLASKKSPVVIADPWWLENADRWEFLREYEIKERADG